MKNIQRDNDHDETHITRSVSIERLLAGEDKQQTVYRVSLSSENPIQDWPWAPPNVLIHSAAAVDLSGISERGLPFYSMHRTHELGSLIGRIVNVRLDKKRLVGELKFSEANPDAAMVRGMVDEGTLTDMSINARPLKVLRIEGVDGKTERVEWQKWRPTEASAVGIGADQSIGIGRSESQTAIAEGTDMPDTNTATAEAQTANHDDEAVKRAQQGKDQLDANFAADNEAKRKKAIGDLARINGIGEDTQREWITRGYSLDRVADDLLRIFEERGKSSPQSISALGMSDSEARQYSLCRAILAANTNDWRKAGFELECHEEVAKRSDKPQTPGVFYVPLEVQRRNMKMPEKIAQDYPFLQRDLTVGSGSGGGYLVQTSVQGFDELLRNISVCFRMGATRLSGLRDNITIPRQSAAATAEWLDSESDSAGESQPAFVQLGMTPKTVSAYTELSRKLLLQSSLDVEGLVNADLAAVTALAVDVAGLRGTGAAGQPLGLDNVTGVGSVSGSSLGLAGVLECQTDVATANVMPMRGGYVTTPTVAALLIGEVAYANTASPLWDGNIWTGKVQGFPAMSSNQVAASTMYFGDWSKMVIGEWGVLEVDTNPYANFGAGIIGVRAMYSVDVGIRYPGGFSIVTGIS